MAELANLFVKLDLKSKGFRTGITKASKAMNKLKSAVFGVKGAVVALAGAYGLAKVAGSFLDAAKATEDYNLRLGILLGSTEKGTELFKEMADYAGRVPFEYDKIMASATQLSGIMKGGVQEIKEWMPLIGDLAAVSGMTIQQTTEQVARMYSAGAASADMFRERGILSMLGFQAGVSYSVEETRKMLMDAWKDPESKFKGATEKMADTWKGLMSMFSDKWFAFRNMVMDTKVFELMKQGASKVLQEIDKLGKEGKLKEWAQSTASFIVRAIGHVVKAIAWIPLAFISVKGAIHDVTTVMAILGTTAVDTLAMITATLNPMAAGRIAASGKSLGEALRDEFPTLAAFRDELDKLGQSQSDTSVKTAESKTKFADWGRDIEAVGQKILKMGETIKGMKDKVGVSTTVVEKFKLSMEQIDGVWVVTKKKLETPAEIKAKNDQAMKEIKDLHTKYKEIKKAIESNPIKPKVEPGIKMSPVVPFRKGIDNMKSMLESLGGSSVPVTFDAGAMGELISQIRNTAILRSTYAHVGGNIFTPEATRERTINYTKMTELQDMQMEMMRMQVQSMKYGLLEQGRSMQGATTGPVTINLPAGMANASNEETARVIRDELERLNARGA